MPSYASVAKHSIPSKVTKKTCDDSHSITVSYTDEEPEIVYVTEKGCDLYKIWPDIAAIDAATKQGYSWYDLFYSSRGAEKRHVRARPVKVVQTTEAELAKIRAAEKAVADQKAAAERQATVSHNVNKIMAIVGGMTHEFRTRDALIDVVVDILKEIPEAIRMEVGDRACELIVEQQLLYIPPPVEESECDTSASTVAYEDAMCVNTSAFQTPLSYITAPASGYVTPLTLDDFPTQGPVVIDGTVFLPAVGDDRTQYLLPIIPFGADIVKQPITVVRPLPPSPPLAPAPAPACMHPHVTTLEAARNRRVPPADAWYLLTKKKFRQGPFNQEQMRTWYVNGELSNDTPVRKGLYGGFKKLRELYGVDSPVAFTY